MVLCEEGREIIQGRRVKSASAYTGTHDVFCPMFVLFPQTTHHLAVVFSTFTEIPGKQVVADMLQCVEVIWLICKRSNWCLTESQVGPIFWLFFGLQGLKNANVDKSWVWNQNKMAPWCCAQWRWGHDSCAPCAEDALSIAQNYHDCTMH